MKPEELQDGHQYRDLGRNTYGTVHSLAGQLVEDGQVYMTIDDPAWHGACRWVDVEDLAPMEETANAH